MAALREPPMIARAHPDAAPPLLIFTDLDGTLLDEQYGWEPARPALDRIRALGIPLVLSSSKTLAEMRSIRSALNLMHPMIFENGAGIAVPDGYFEAPGNGATATGLVPETFGPGYAELRRILDEMRERRRYPFRGFGDMTSAEVARLTGLDQVSAARARQRIGSEPGVWEGSEAVRQDFIRELGEYGLNAVRGGRFLHIMPSVDKVTAMEVLVSRYRACWPGHELPVVAAGDSPNDAAMLRAADRAVVIRSSDGAWMPLGRREGVLRSPEPGPAGWNHCMNLVLDEFTGVAGEAGHE